MIEITTENFEEKVETASDKLVYFGSAMCGPCRLVSKTMEKLTSEGVEVFKVDADMSAYLVAEHEINTLPTVLVYKNGKKTQEIVGLQMEKVYTEALA